MKKRSGIKSSPLDDIGAPVCGLSDLLELRRVSEKTAAGHREQKSLLDAVLDRELFYSHELPRVPDSARETPKVSCAWSSDAIA